METMMEKIMEYPGHIVLTVPMRNGNPNWRAIRNRDNLSSYRTYEEWKRVKKRGKDEEVSEFLPYL